MKGDITEEIPAIMRYDQPNQEPVNGEPKQRSGAILWMALGFAVAVVLILACLADALL